MATIPELKLKEGDKAPPFSADSSAGPISLADFAGKPVVLYFYPKDDTPGCTKEACGFRDVYSDLTQAGIVILGISTDSTRAHAKFIEKYKLPFTLVADPGMEIVRKFGVWGEKRFMGRKYEGTHRVTFLIGRDGRIRKIWPKVKPEEHAAEVLAAALEP